jgi:N-acetylglucosaminyldiphosphoundecaprenol N-acetyl-beta-D-mannosaminyltransferase
VIFEAPSFSLFGQRYFRGSLPQAARWILDRPRRSRMVCVANVHTAMQSLWDAELRAASAGAELRVPDGRPLAWMAQWKGITGASQVRGADLMLAVAKQGGRHYFFGGAPGVAKAAAARLKALAPKMTVAGAEAPPFRPLSAAEEKALLARIKRLKVDVLWVGLGAPKQERWMAAMQGRLPATMVGVGAAFDYYAGTVAEAPRWVQRAGLEWAYRLKEEPRRLWRRYLLTNSLFLWLAPVELLGLWPRRSAP